MKNLLILIVLSFVLFSCGGSSDPVPQNIQNTNIQTCDGGNCDYIDINTNIEGDGNTVGQAINDVIENVPGFDDVEEIAENAANEAVENLPESEEVVEGFTFEETEQVNHDLESIGARLENDKVQIAANYIQFEFGLSADRSYSVAKMMRNYKSLQNERSMTNKDLSVLTESLLGVKVEDIHQMVKDQVQGDDQAYNNFIENAAYVNGTTPENMNKIINNIL